MAAIDGLGSGLDTSSIIKQLMDLERLPQTRLSTQKTAATTRSTTWSQLDLALGAVKTAAVKLATPQAISGAVKASSADATAVGVTANLDALPGTYKVAVTSLATARQMTTGSVSTTVGTGSLVLHAGLSGTGLTAVEDDAFSAAGSPLSQTYKVSVANDGMVTVSTGTTSVSGAFADGENTLTLGGLNLTKAAGTLTPPSPGVAADVTVARVKTAPGSLTDLAKAVNAAGGVATATVVNTGADTGTMVLSAKKTGTGDTLGVGSSLAALPTSAFGHLADTGTNGTVSINNISITGVTSNTLTGAIPGVTLSLLKGGTTEVTVAQDVAGPAAQVKSVVDTVNDLFAKVTSATKYDVATKRAAPLTGNAAVRQITNDLYNAVGSVAPAGSGNTLAAIGISVKSDGTYAFDESKLTASLTANPTATAELVVKLTTKLSDYVDGLRNGKVVNGQQMPGLITAGKDSAASEAERLQKRIEEWDRRLALTQSRLTKQYTALDSALGGLKSQGTWLSGAIGSLGSWGE